jgi:predicted ATPase
MVRMHAECSHIDCRVIRKQQTKKRGTLFVEPLYDRKVWLDHQLEKEFEKIYFQYQHVELIKACLVINQISSYLQMSKTNTYWNTL